VRLQRLDAGDRLAELVLVPPAPEGEEEPLVEPASAEATEPSEVEPLQADGEGDADAAGDDDAIED
jgi:DNA gyrase subunit A